VARVLIADDHAVVRAGYRQFLEAESRITEIGEAATGQEVLEQLLASHWDVLLLDVRMPDRGGIEILRDVIAGYPKVRVLVISELPVAQYAGLVIREGASGYLCKNGSPEDLLDAVRTALSGRRYVSPTLAESIALHLRSRHDLAQPQHDRLSRRELQVFLKLATGEGISAIADELALSVKTVSTYRSRILEKMGFHSNADITGYALRNNMVMLAT
jgi:two-component system invasion response regulator UvrY